jgi:hypothetical protein
LIHLTGGFSGGPSAFATPATPAMRTPRHIEDARMTTTPAQIDVGGTRTPPASRSGRFWTFQRLGPYPRGCRRATGGRDVTDRGTPVSLACYRPRLPLQPRSGACNSRRTVRWTAQGGLSYGPAGGLCPDPLHRRYADAQFADDATNAVACREPFGGDDPVAFVVSVNPRRGT